MSRYSKTAGILFPAIRLSFGVVLLTACILFLAEVIGITPNENKFKLDVRKAVSESLAIQFSIFAPGQKPQDIQKMISQVVKRTPDVLSAGIRLNNGQLIFQIGDHLKNWEQYNENKSNATHLIVPIHQHGETWGNIEVKFKPLSEDSLTGLVSKEMMMMTGFILAVGFFVYLAFMIRTLTLLDPTAVVPDRVNAAFDTLAEGIIILDESEHIVLANKAFTDKLAKPANSIIGVKLSSLPWKGAANTEIPDKKYPWQQVQKTGKSFLGAQLLLTLENGKLIKFILNITPIETGKNIVQGILISLDDVTELDERNTALEEMVSRLEQSQIYIEQQNKELNYLATRDSLTGCLNRRAFNDQYEKLRQEARQNKTDLAFVMTDLDYFKKVNDTYGHETGDAVIKLYAEVLQANVRKIDLVGRYGGEEFSLALPGLSADEAFTVAERIRLRVKDESAHRFENKLRVTASFGICSINICPENVEYLQQNADEALYMAKESGRNRVVLWHQKNQQFEASPTPLEPEPMVLEDVKTQELDSIEALQSRVTELENIASQFSAEIEYSKNYDQLTGLPNHILFYDRVAQVITRSNRHSELTAVLVVDISMVSLLNSTLGRYAGDALLASVADRLKVIFRKYDAISRLTISRFGGNEFAVLISNLASKEALTWIVLRLQSALAEPINIDDNNIFLITHIGVGLYPSDADNVDDLLKNASLAQKYSKQHYTESHFQFFDENMQKLSAKHISLDKELRSAIQNEEWVLLYQPKMDIKTRTIVGVEALIRWRHPVRGILSPYEFIDFAEQRGLITAIGDWVIKAACLQIKKWISLGIIDCKISINVSTIQIKQENFIDKVYQTLSETDIPPRQLEIELTESALMNNLDQALRTLIRLNSRGITIAIDDFGTGYSSLGYLKNLPINTLKIDRVFIKDISTDENDKQIVKALIGMAHALRMKVVAEGVEYSDQYDILEQYSCDEIQGYLLSKPIPESELTEMLLNNSFSSAPTFGSNPVL